ncbi:MAG: MFS transporter [Acidobacteria bacterium]|nr:MFS transporter [Acidobacteriota bacterium]MCZ6876527.1 MFS transporter [Acidobacteriota bacterium]
MPKVQGSRVIIAVLFGVLFLATADNQLLIPLLPILGRELDVSMRTLGWLFSGYALAAALCSLCLGPLSDRFGRLIFLRIGLFLFSLIALLTYTVQGYSQLFWLRVSTGLMAGLLSTCTASLVGDFFPYERRGRAMGVILSSYFAALILGVPMAAWVAQTWNWRTIFLGSSLVAFLLLICSLFFLPQETLSLPRSMRFYFGMYPRLLQHRERRAAVAVSFCVSGATLAFLTFISDYLNQSFGLRPIQIAWLFVTAGVAAAVGSLISGWISDRFTKRRVFLVANTLLIVPLLALDRLEWGSPLFGLFFIISLCIAFRQTALHTLQTELVQREQRGSFLALRNTFSQVGISVSVLVAGNLYSQMGYRGVTLWAALLTLLGSVMLYQVIEEPTKQQ